MTIFDLVSFEPDRYLTLRTSGLGHIVVTYLVAADGGGSRLLVKLRASYGPGWRDRLLRNMLPAGDLIMMRRQLRNIASLSQRTASCHS